LPTRRTFEKLALVMKMVLHFLVKGRVQGVGFRWFVQREATELDLRGWVRNTEDGDVEVVAAGDVADLAELRESLRKGPRGSRVDNLIEHYLDEKEADGLDSFHIEGAW
jgi:acylphosphatase